MDDFDKELAELEEYLAHLLEPEVNARITEMWLDGDLRFLLLPHQDQIWADFWAWNEQRQTEAHKERNRAKGGRYHRIWVDEWGRRVGKTSLALIRAQRENIRRPEARGMIFTPKQKNIGGIIVPLARVLFASAPAGSGLAPVYRATIGGEHECLLTPATGSVCKLVGVDLHPDATRGQWLDYCIGTETAFVKGLTGLWRGTIAPQFRGRPWGWGVFESSTAKQPDCEFNTEFREDALVREFDPPELEHPVGGGRDELEERRHPYRLRTLDDHTTLTPEERKEAIDDCGGEDTPDAKRELWCIEVRDPKGTVIPEFDAPTRDRPHTRHVIPAGSPLPRYARCYVGMDQGYSQDPLGLVFAVHDFERNKLIFIADHQELNMGLRAVAEKLREVEGRLWWTIHRLPGQAGPMIDIRDVVRTKVDKLALETPEPALTYWHEEQFKPNPYKRVSDVAPQMIGDLAKEYAINFETTAKDDPEAARNQFRLLFTDDRIEIWDCCEHLIKQCRSGMWNEKRTDYERTPTLGHLDCMQAAIYLTRNVDWRQNPYPPARIETALHGVALPLGIDKDTALGRTPAVPQRFDRGGGHDSGWR